MSVPAPPAPDSHAPAVAAERRAKPFGQRFAGAAPTVRGATELADRELAAKVTLRDWRAARARAVERLRTATTDASSYEDAVLLARVDPGFTWENWAVAGMSACPALAPRLLALVPEDELAEFAVRTRLPWSALRHQADGGAALHLLALRVGALLLRGELDEAFAAIVEPGIVEQGRRDPATRAIVVAVASVLTWRDAVQGEQASGLLRIADAQQEPAPDEPYPLDVLEDARQLSALMRRVAARAPMPPALARVLHLGPLFAGPPLRALLDELAAAIRSEPTSFLRWCDAAIEVSPPLGLFLSNVIAELHHEAPATADTRAEPSRAHGVLAELARSESRRGLAATLSALVAGAALGVLVPRGQLDLALVIAAPFALGTWALLSHVPRMLYGTRARLALARWLAADARNAGALAAALATRALRGLASRVEGDAALELFGVLACRRGILPRKE